MRWKPFKLPVYATLACFCVVPTAPFPDTAWADAGEDKIKVERLDDLPRHTYTSTKTPSELLTADAEFRKLAAEVQSDIEDLLAKYDIADNNTLQQMYGALSWLAFLDGDYDAVRRYTNMQRDLELKESKKLVGGTVTLSYIDALAKHPDPASDEFRAELRNNIRKRVEKMPWDVVQEDIEHLNGQMQIISDNVLLSVVQSQLDGPVAKAGFMSRDQAGMLVNFRLAKDVIIPVKDDVSAVLSEQIAANKSDKVDIWPARSVTFTGDEGYSPVVVAIWDTGVDMDVFKDQAWTNPRERIDNKDNDGNGFVDDVHGIAWDLNNKATTVMEYPLGEHEKDRAELQERLKGMFDNTASLDTPEAREIRQKLSTLGPDEIRPYVEATTLYAYHAHGTHVAGIAIDGNPYARVMNVRLTADHHWIPEVETMEKARAMAEASKRTIEYLKANDVRVVNMSWVLSVKEYEDNLEKNGVGKSPEERAKMAREMFEVVKNALYDAFKSAQEIVFVGGAGNSDNDVEFDEFIPPAFDLPNLIIAGAVDQAGEATNFTSFGRTVAVYSNGFEVDSYVPRGHRMKLSGTSMASPNVANLAAKLIARDPSLKPEEVIQLIKEGADDMGEGRPMLVINPKRSMELLEAKTAQRSG